jgi:hypothetical protein
VAPLNPPTNIVLGLISPGTLRSRWDIKRSTYHEVRPPKPINLTTSLLSSSARMDAFLELLGDLWAFMRARQKYWLVPLILALVFMGALLVFTKGSVVAPFIYSLF